MIIIRYDATHNCGNDAAARCGRWAICGVDYNEIGVDTHDNMVRTIQQMSSNRDMGLPLRGDSPLYPRSNSNYLCHGYANEGYKSMAAFDVGVWPGGKPVLWIAGLVSCLIRHLSPMKRRNRLQSGLR